MKKNAIVLNVETTGLDSKADELLRVSIISDSGETLFDEFIRPTHHTEWPDAEEIHHITPEQVKDCHPILYHAKEIQQIIDKADVVIGYNHSFDMAFLMAAGIQYNPKKNYDIMLEFSQLVGEWDADKNQYRWFKIKDCADYLGYQWESDYSHDCLEDCKATLYCYKKILDGETGKGGVASERSLQSAYNTKPQKVSGLAIAGAILIVTAMAFASLFMHVLSREKAVLQGAKIADSDKYLQYQSLDSSGQLNENNEYSSNVSFATNDHTGAIHVTFAANSFTDIFYFYDEARTKKIDIADCYLSPQDKIYPGEIIYKSSLKNNSYKIVGFDLKEIDSNTGEIRTTSYNQDTKVIPLSVSGHCTEVCIVPRGEFTYKKLQLNAYYYDSNNEKKPLNCQWSCNDVPYDGTTGISPLSDYYVKCNYSNYADSYYFVASSPQQQYVNQDHVVVFPLAAADKNVETFEVELHPYIALAITDSSLKPGIGPIPGKDSAIISIEKERAEDRVQIHYNEGKQIKAEDLSYLQHGDKIYVTVDNNYQAISPNKNMKAEQENALNGNRTEYVFRIPKDNYKSLQIIVNEKNLTSDEPVYLPVIQNTDVSLKYQEGSIEISSGDAKPSPKAKVILTITPDDGYYLEGKKLGKKLGDNGVYTEEMTFEKYEKEIDTLLQKLNVKKYIRLTLSSDENGTAIYKLDKTQVEGTILAKEGQVLAINYKISPDSNCRIVTEKGKQKESGKSERVLIPDMDGSTIRPSDFFTLKAG